MIDMTILYWLTRLDSLKIFIEVLSITFIIIGAAATIGLLIIAYLVENVDVDEKKMLIYVAKKFIMMFIIGITFLFINIFIPNKKEMAFIYITPIVINSKFIQEDLPQEGKEIYNYFKDYIKADITCTNGVLNSIKNSRRKLF